MWTSFQLPFLASNTMLTLSPSRRYRSPSAFPSPSQRKNPQATSPRTLIRVFRRKIRTSDHFAVWRFQTSRTSFRPLTGSGIPENTAVASSQRSRESVSRSARETAPSNACRRFSMAWIWSWHLGAIPISCPGSCNSQEVLRRPRDPPLSHLQCSLRRPRSSPTGQGLSCRPNIELLLSVSFGPR